MIKIKKSIPIYMIAFMLLLNLIFIGEISAASASISIKNSRSTLMVGNSVTTTVTVSSSSPLGSWNFDVKYDSTRLKLESSSFGGLYIADVCKNSTQKTAAYTFTFKALKSGNASIYIANSLVYGYDESVMSKTNGSSTINIMTQAQLDATYSKNNYLSSLGIEGATLTPEFNKDVTEYSVELEPNTESINVAAAVADSKANVIGTGIIAVSEGDNRLEVKVTAENGNEKIYVLNVKVKELSPINIKIGKKKYTVVRKKGVVTMPTNYTETTVMISNEEVPAFTSEITKFILVGLKDAKGNAKLYIYNDKNDETYALYNEFSFNRVVLYTYNPGKEIKLPTGYKKYTIKIGNKELEVYKIKQTSKYSLIYGMNVETGKTGFYLYDSEEQTLQKYYKEEVKVLKNTLNNYFFIILSLSFSSLLFLGILLFIIIKKQKIKLAK